VNNGRSVALLEKKGIYLYCSSRQSFLKCVSLKDLLLGFFFRAIMIGIALPVAALVKIRDIMT
jgi:hypothetical protein